MTANQHSEPLDEAAGPGGGQMLLAMVALFLIVLTIVGLVALTAWVALVAAVLLMALGALAVTRYVSRISTTREAEAHHTAGVDDALTVTDDPHAQISRHDIPVGGPERQAAPTSSVGDEPRA